MGVITSRLAPLASPTSDSINDLLQEIDDFVATDEIVGIDPTPNVAVEFQGEVVAGDNTNSTVQQTIAKYKKKIEEKKLELKALKAERDAISRYITKDRTLLSTRNKSKDGIYSQMADVLKSIGVEHTQYPSPLNCQHDIGYAPHRCSSTHLPFGNIFHLLIYFWLI